MATISRARPGQYREIAVLFDLYRQFYEQDPDAAGCEAYIRDRLIKEQSVIFTAIDELVELAAHANIPMTNDQAMQLAYIVFAKNPLLLHDIRQWNARPALMKTWPHMKTFFRQAQTDLRSLQVTGTHYQHNPNQANFTAPIIADPSFQQLPPPGFPLPPMSFPHGLGGIWI